MNSRATPREPGDDELGSALHVLSIALGAGGALSTLATSLRAWFAQPRRSDVSLRIQRADGSVIVLDAKRVSDVEGLVRALGADPDEEGE